MMATIDHYSVATVPIEMHFGTTHLSLGTGFVWLEAGHHYLITNWHNVSGKDPNTGRHLSATAAEPDQLRIWWNRRGALGTKDPVFHAIRDDQNAPLWLVHPSFRNAVDVVALPIEPPSAAEPYPINQMPTDPLKTEIGSDVFVLGYPFGIAPGGFPIWKRGSIASEPNVLSPQQPFVLIDTASRPGMSGSPVIRRVWGTALMDNGSMNIGTGTSTRLFGIYSGRMHSADPIDAQLGMAWPVEFIGEIIGGGVRDS